LTVWTMVDTFCILQVGQQKHIHTDYAHIKEVYVFPDRNVK